MYCQGTGSAHYKFIGRARQSAYIAGRLTSTRKGFPSMFKNAYLAFVLAGAVAAGPCLAHAKLQNSTPADNGVLTQAPKTLTLNFSEAAQLATLKLVRDGKDISVPVDQTAKASQSIIVTLPSLVPGKYIVHWSAMAADDGHVTRGSFIFSIAG
jgi:methionine-rich copper-binding protein CopC